MSAPHLVSDTSPGADSGVLPPDAGAAGAAASASGHHVLHHVTANHGDANDHHHHHEDDPEHPPGHVRDSDSAYGSDSFVGEEETRSLASFITDYVYENGRRYHSFGDGAYWGPNDDHANSLAKFTHHMYLVTLDNKLHLAPISNPQRILDIGTGTGVWAIGMADLYPGAHITGTDLSPIQPEFVPPNCTFEIDDATREWTYPLNHFDFIHVRELYGSISNWDRFFQQIFRHLKPGGYVEIVEHSVEPVSDDGTVGPDHFFTRWGRTAVELGERTGKSFTIYRESRERLMRAGFTDVAEAIFKWPINPWIKNNPKMESLGGANQRRLHNGIEGDMIRLLTNVAGWSYDQAQRYFVEMRNNLVDPNTHAYIPGTVVYGRKPMS